MSTTKIQKFRLRDIYANETSRSTGAAA